MIYAPDGSAVVDMRSGPKEILLEAPKGVLAIHSAGADVAFAAAAYQRDILVLSAIHHPGFVWKPEGAAGSLHVPMGSSVELRSGDTVCVPFSDGTLGPWFTAAVPDPVAERARAVLGRLGDEDSASDAEDGGKGKKKKKKAKKVGAKELGEYTAVLRAREKAEARADRQVVARAARAKARAATHTFEAPDAKLRRLGTKDREAFAKEYDEIKPFCKYGPTCYQKNDHHLATFRHDFAARTAGEKDVPVDPLDDDEDE